MKNIKVISGAVANGEKVVIEYNGKQMQRKVRYGLVNDGDSLRVKLLVFVNNKGIALEDK